jgi:hypothetical protein
MSTTSVLQFLQSYETDILRNLLIAREQANENVRSYLLQVLKQHGLDPSKYGISQDLHSFIEIQPVTPVEDPAPTAE